MNQFRSTQSDVDLCLIYQSNHRAASGREAAEALLHRHDPILRRFAGRTFRHTDARDTFDDYLQHARLFALAAYLKFEPDRAAKRGCSVKTFVYLKVSMGLTKVPTANALIRIPERKRAARAYVLGRSSEPTFQESFEREHGLSDGEAKAHFCLLHSALRSLPTSLNELTHCEATSMLDEHGMCLRMDIHRCLHQLSPKHFEILDLVVNEGLSHAEAGNRMGLTQIQVKNQINYARRKLTKLMLMG